jgi:hypothetical protein
MFAVWRQQKPIEKKKVVEEPRLEQPIYMSLGV